MKFEEPFMAAVQEAATPSEADGLVARDSILAALPEGDAPIVTTKIESRWLEAIGTQRRAERTKFTALNCSSEPSRWRLLTM